MIQYVSADISNDGHAYIRMKDTNHLVLTIWERHGNNWLICDCKDISTVERPLTEQDIGYYSVIGARIVKAMTEVPR